MVHLTRFGGFPGRGRMAVWIFDHCQGLHYTHGACPLPSDAMLQLSRIPLIACNTSNAIRLLYTLLTQRRAWNQP